MSSRRTGYYRIFRSRNPDSSSVPIISATPLQSFIHNNDTIKPPSTTTFLFTNISFGAGYASAEPKAIEAAQTDQATKSSLNQNLSLEIQVAGKETMTYCPDSLSSLQCATRNIIDELSSFTIGSNSTSGSLLTQQESEKLFQFLDMSLEAISQANAFNDVEKLILKIAEQETDPIKKTSLSKVLTRITEFKDSIPNYLTVIETSINVESSRAHDVHELEAKLVEKQNQICLMESEVCRMWEEETKLESKIKLMIARRDKMAEERKSRTNELMDTNREASRELEEVKKQVAERDQARDNKLTAKEKIAQSNASWKFLKEYLLEVNPDKSAESTASSNQ